MFLQLESILQSELTFPALECFHLCGLALGVGTIAAVDFRLLNCGMQSQRAKDLAADLAPWNTIGIGVALLAGGGLFMSDPDLYYLNHSFQLKMTLLVIALTFHYAVHQKKIYSGAAEESIRWVGAVSLLLWAAIVFSGIFIAFTGEAA